MKVIRALFAAAEPLAPRFAGLAAFELFCRTPNPNRQTEGERRAVARAADFMAEARHHRLRTSKGCVAVHEFRPRQGRVSAGTVLVIHGWRSRTEHMGTLIDGFVAAGYRVVSLDLPGHGQSPGRRLTLVSAVEAAWQAGQWFGPFRAVVGHSFGGAVAVNAVTGSIPGVPPLAAERLVLIAAPASVPTIVADFCRMLNVGPRARTAMADRIERIAGRPLSEFLCDRLLAGTCMPTLVIHAPDDREVSADEARLFAGAGPHVRLYWAEGLGHRRILADRKVADQAVSFVVDEPALAVMASSFRRARPAAPPSSRR